MIATPIIVPRMGFSGGLSNTQEHIRERRNGVKTALCLTIDRAESVRREHSWWYFIQVVQKHTT